MAAFARTFDEHLVPEDEPVAALATLLDEAVEVVRRFVVVSEAQADAIGLWVAHTFAIEAAEATPYLAVTSAEKRCGKSRLLETIALLVARPLRAAGATEAALFRSLAVSPPPTLLMDEVDALFGPKAARDHEDLRALLNAGYRRGTPVLRCVGDGARQRVEPFAVFGAKALAGIGRLPETVLDRSLPIWLKRRAPGETVERLRERDAREEVAPLREQLASWAEQSTEVLGAARPALPEELDDRAQDACEPLVAIADLAGGSWPGRARAAVVALRGREDADEEASLGVRLLADIRALWTTAGFDQRPSADLIEELRALEESPWGELGGGLTTRSLARLLRPYGIRPRDIRVGERALKGYRRYQFEDAWRRYLPPGKRGATEDAAASRDKRDIGLVAGDPQRFGSATETTSSRIEERQLPLARADVAAVALPASPEQSDGGCEHDHHGLKWRLVAGRLVCPLCHPAGRPGNGVAA